MAADNGTDFERELAELLNRHSVENASNTPDYLLACFMVESLTAFNKAVSFRDRWYGIAPAPGWDRSASDQPARREDGP